MFSSPAVFFLETFQQLAAAGGLFILLVAYSLTFHVLTPTTTRVCVWFDTDPSSSCFQTALLSGPSKVGGTASCTLPTWPPTALSAAATLLAAVGRSGGRFPPLGVVVGSPHNQTSSLIRARADFCLNSMRKHSIKTLNYCPFCDIYLSIVPFSSKCIFAKLHHYVIFAIDSLTNAIQLMLDKGCVSKWGYVSQIQCLFFECFIFTCCPVRQELLCSTLHCSLTATAQDWQAFSINHKPRILDDKTAWSSTFRTFRVTEAVLLFLHAEHRVGSGNFQYNIIRWLYVANSMKTKLLDHNTRTNINTCCWILHTWQNNRFLLAITLFTIVITQAFASGKTLCSFLKSCGCRLKATTRGRS